MKKLALNVIAAVVTILGLGCVASISPAYAEVTCVNGKTASSLQECDEYENLNYKDRGLMETLTIVINVVVGVVGFVAVVMIVLGGINFATSQGDTSKVTKARNTILYGVVGLVVAILAFAIVNFVLTSVFAS